MRADLLLGVYRPGEFLRLVEMEARYAASRFEVRSAFATLAANELLEHVPNRGYCVTALTDEEARQHTELRLLLEVPAASLVLRHARPADHDALRRHAGHFAWCVENGGPGELEHANHRFHRAFFTLCGNERLERMINAARERAWPSGWVHWKTVAMNRVSAADHVAMVDALATRDEATLRRVAFRHLLWRAEPRPELAAILGVLEADAGG